MPSILRFLYRITGQQRRDRAIAIEAYERFMKPQEQRLLAMGVSEYETFLLRRIAIRHADLQTLFPGAILREMADAIERGDTTAPRIIYEHYMQN